MQTSYPTSINANYFAGIIVDSSNKEVSTYIVPSNQEVEAGLAVEWWGGSVDNEAAITSQAIKPIGVAARNTLDTDDTETITYVEGDEFPLISRGVVGMQSDGDFDVTDEVFVRYRFFTQIISVVFDIDFVASNVINGTVGGEAIAPVTFATSHTATFNALVSAIQATALTRTISSNPATRTILITVDPDVAEPLDPLGDYVSTTNFTVTLGASQAVDTVSENRAPSSNLIRGGVRADDDDTGAGATAFAVPQMRFLNSGTQGDIALVEVNLP